MNLERETKGREVELSRGRVEGWKVNDKPRMPHPSKSHGKRQRRRQRGMRRGREGREEKTTATELCRGFNQPNYSLITETQNLEQLTHAQTHTRTHTHTHTHSLAHIVAHSSLW